MAGAIAGAMEKGNSAGDVEHTQILGGATHARQHVHHQREVDRQVHAEAEPADGHADEEAVEVAGDGDHEQRQAIHDRRGEDEDLPPACPVRDLPADEGSGDDDGGLGKRAQKYLLRPDPVRRGHPAPGSRVTLRAVRPDLRLRTLVHWPDMLP